MLFATTSNGVYRCNVARGEAQRILDKGCGAGVVKAEARGYFGITRHLPTGQILVASRERGRLRFGQLADRVKLYSIGPRTSQSTLMADIRDVHDVHQIAWHDGQILLTDTGKNRIVVCNLSGGDRRTAVVGDIRDDINHINALLVHEGSLYVGLNNRGQQPAELLQLPMDQLHELLEHGMPDLAKHAHHIVFDDIIHTHDLESDARGKLFACVSYAGSVLDVARRKTILKVGDWTRGLAFATDKLWVGTSELAGRKERHSEHLDGAISLYSLPDLKFANRLVLRGAGQVNDLLYVEEDSTAG